MKITKKESPRKGKKKVVFEREFKEEKNKIEKVLLNKSPLSGQAIVEKGGTIPPSTIKEDGKTRPNPEYIKKVPKYIQTNLYDGSNKERLTLCKEGRVFRLHRDDFLEHKKQKIKIPAKQFMGYYGGWKKQIHSYYFAIPKTYFIKTKIFDEIIRKIFLESKEICAKCGKNKISKYIEHKEEIEELLKDAEKFMSWIEIFPNTQKPSKSLYKPNNFTKYICDFICEKKNVRRNLFIFRAYCLAYTLRKIEDLLLFGNPNISRINVYRIFRDELSERKIIELPEDYEKHIEEKIYEKAFLEEWKRLEEDDLEEIKS